MPNDAGASNFGGQKTWSFNQGNYNSMLKKHPNSKGGICEALAVSWISKGLQSGLQDALSTGGDVDKTKVAVVAQRFASMYRFKFKDGTEGDPLKGFQMIKESQKYLESQGFKHITHVGKASKQKDKVGNPPLKEQFSIVFDGIEAEQCFTQQTQTIYSMLRFSGAKWAHATAFRIEPTADKTTYYFDPNAGEFKFLKFAQFRKWYENYHSSNRLYRTSATIGFQLLAHNDR
ncbi:YopT-type cysteine protease domain-containing protein [Microbulbifer sp. CNSA002]|uniref:YopT-type cysteine protease domain-containing protein n=1 Tax=unclassified Microbulbifer TaxID=2619833 RepID=UPI002B31E7AE|nr:YopT-type cysteine protease domain-containing protein [Microbulbifer sp. MKSA007]